ncbi:MAG: HAD family hydrolase [Nitrospirota bacterium]
MRYDNIKLLIFDLDGTLIDSKRDIATAVNLTFREIGLPEKEPEVIYGYVGDGVRMLIQRSLGNDCRYNFDEAISIFRRHYLAHLLDTTRFYPEIEEVLDYYRNKKKAIVTNKPIEYTSKIIDGLGVNDRFHIVVGGERGYSLKPEPDMILKVIDELKVNNELAVLIGDSINDILAARAAGIRSCAVGYGLGEADILKESKPDIFCKRVEDLKGLF